MPAASTGPRLLVEFIWANIRHSRPMMTVAPLAMMAGAGAVQRVRHRLVAVLVVVQLLAIAGDQQQRVVDARAKHQDAAGCLRSGR